MPRTGSRFKYRPDGGTADQAATIFRRYGAVPHALAQKTRGKHQSSAGQSQTAEKAKKAREIDDAYRATMALAVPWRY